ncbi:beta-galactosidase [Naasia sp. SYSU D00057]|uniref:beta-galactosidase n=1 Tax=Naasia sp. SYSU D00057 TaxID=2817380 RepID=UPI001B315B12|nr:beta-galactosidase [Naasia sp. SYSU D00057]
MPLWYGGDYNPEQWPEEVWEEDVRLMQRAGVNLATVGVFSWAKLEPRDGEFDFGWLDRILDQLHEGGVRVDLATATASPPAWLAKMHPEMLPVTAEGTKLWPGSRQHYCPSSPVYREHARRLVTAIAERYAEHPALELWHVNNEYGCHVSRCYCDASAAAFRGWLENRYSTVEALNEAWGTAFWSQRYDSFDEVLPPRAAPTFQNPTQLLDFDRFSSDELLACYRAEVEVLRRVSPDVPITTNFMGFFKPVDYWAWAKEVDVVADDSYPDPADPDAPAYAAMQRDLMRSLRGGQPWLLMEQAPSAVNWRQRNAPKAAGQMRAWSYQALARGADGILYFQWRQSAAGAEKFHSGMVPHSGTETRVWREIEELGQELAALSDSLAGTRVGGDKAAIVLDWDSWWAIEQPASPTALPYLDGIFAWHRSLTALGLTVDFVQADGPLADYPVVVVPSLFVASDAQLQHLHDYAAAGGRLVVTHHTGILDENLHVRLGGYLGRLQETLGVWIEEFSPTAGAIGVYEGAVVKAESAEVPAARLRGDVLGGSAAASSWGEVLHPRSASVLAEFAHAGLEGSPAVTVNEIGDGAAWYVATLPEPSAREALLSAIVEQTGMTIERVPEGQEVVRRGPYTFRIDLVQNTVEVEGAVDSED